MSIREEILPFIDGNGLVAPNVVTPGLTIGSDNGPMFTSEFYIILAKSGLLTDIDKTDYAKKINSCINEQGMLNRVPTTESDGIEGPDDYYGVMNGCKQLSNIEIPRKILWATFRYFGALNNVNPGKWTAESFFVRQIQLLASMITAAFPTWNPVHIFMRLLFFPAFFVAAISIAISCIGTPVGDVDPRRLSWHLLQTTSSVSIMCKLASLIWYKRLKKDYGDELMLGVTKIYYRDNHPFQRYWIS